MCRVNLTHTNIHKQAGAELDQAQLKLGLDLLVVLVEWTNFPFYFILIGFEISELANLAIASCS